MNARDEPEPRAAALPDCGWPPAPGPVIPPALFCILLDEPPAVPPRLSAEEETVAARFRTPLLRARYRAAHGALRLILAAACGRPAETLRFPADAGGKPRLCLDRGDPPLSFSLSHSEGVALVAVAQGEEIGVDVEAVRPLDDLDALADRVFTPAEVAMLPPVGDAARLVAFHARWTAKEAAMKALGLGLSLDPSRFAVTERGYAAADPDDDQRAALAQLAWRPLAPCTGFAGALAGPAPLADYRLHRWR